MLREVRGELQVTSADTTGKPIGDHSPDTAK